MRGWLSVGLLVGLVFSYRVESPASPGRQPGPAVAYGKIDTNRARLLWQRASAVSIYNPTLPSPFPRAASFSQSVFITWKESQGRWGSWPTHLSKSATIRALELNFEKLQLEEKGTGRTTMPECIDQYRCHLMLSQEEYWPGSPILCQG